MTNRIVFDADNQALPPPPLSAPLQSPFPVALASGTAVNLAAVTLSAAQRGRTVLRAVVNWSATYTPPATDTVLLTPGFAGVTFEILRNGTVIYRVAQTAVQNAFFNQPAGTVSPLTTYQIAALLHVDAAAPCRRSCPKQALPLQVYLLRAANIFLVAPEVAAGAAQTTAAVGAVTFIAEKTKTCRCRSAAAAVNVFTV